MSLKAFHIVFIIASAALAFGCAVWSFQQYLSPDGVPAELAGGIGSALGGAALIVYGIFFWKKLKQISSL